MNRKPTAGNQVFHSDATKEAYARGDYDAIKATEKQASRDLLPNLISIDEHGEKAFVQIKNKDGSKHHICASNKGWIWVSAILEDLPLKGAPGAGARRVSQMLEIVVGTYSATAETLRITVGTWDLSWGGTAGIVAGLVTFILSKYFQDRILGYLSKTAICRAIQSAASKVAALAPKVMEMTARFTAFAVRLLGSVAVGIVTGMSVDYLVGFLWQGYTLRVDISNWLTSDWRVIDWYSCNAKVGEDEEWEQAVIPGASSEYQHPIVTIYSLFDLDAVKMPDHVVVPSEVSTAWYSGYVYQNSEPSTSQFTFRCLTFDLEGTFLKGLGVAMKIVKEADKSKGVNFVLTHSPLPFTHPPFAGFFVKYGLWRFSNNQIGLQAGLDTDLKTFYDNPNTWVPGQRASVQYDGVTLTATTDALGGASDRLYRFDVHIGVTNHGGRANCATIQG